MATATRTAPLPAAVDPAHIGARVRSLREAMGLSLRELGERAGVSAPMLSQVERGETSPTLAVAHKIATGLELTLSQLLRLDETEGVTVIRPHERREGSSRASGHSYQLLTPELPGQRAEVSRHSLDAGAMTGGPEDPPLHAAGSRETAVVLRGRVDLVCAGTRYELSEGDSVTFDADLPHHFENPGRSEARFMAVVTAGLRRS
jgi:transcriptional regulator with XRE-family HTH domain